MPDASVPLSRNRDFQLLWVGQALSALGSRVSTLAFVILCDAVRAVALASIPGALVFDRLTFAHVVAVAAIDGAGWTVFEVAQRSALRHVVAFEQLPAAVVRIQAREYAALLLGKPLGGVLFAFGRMVPFVFDALSYAASSVSLLLMRARFEEPRVTARQHPFRELAEGVASSP
jgi:hypothetical protein